MKFMIMAVQRVNKRPSLVIVTLLKVIICIYVIVVQISI